MSTDEHFVLPDEVAFMPVDDIDEQFRKSFDYEPGDIVISNYSSRTNSKVISSEFAELLREFKTPKTIAEVIYNYASLHQTDPLHLADETFSLLMNMRKAGFLISCNKDNSFLQKSMIKDRDSFRQYKIVRKCWGLEDTEVYQVKDADENLYALKLLNASVNDHVKAMFYNELKTFQHLDGLVNPVLKEHGKEEDILYIVMEWCDGLTCIHEAAKYRNINTRKNIVKLLDLSIAVTEAFYHLHQQGVMHGDIHPRNVFISEKGTLKIIDYGYAALRENENPIQRGGTGFYYEPEFATAAFEDKPRPPLTEKGEQYSVAVIIYRLLTGQDYLDFSVEREKLYKQIAIEQPTPFSYFDLQLPQELELVLKKALSKDPPERYDSLKQFTVALRKVRNHIFTNTDFFILNRENGEQEFKEYLIRKFGWHSKYIEKGLHASPTGSVNYGAAGIAYMYYRMACVRQDASLASLADIWINRASQYENDFDKSFYSSEIEITAKSVGKRSIYHSPAGVFLTHTLISSAKGDYDALSKSLNGFLMAAKAPCDNIDLAVGKTGILIGCAILFREFKHREGFQTTQIENLADTAIAEIWSQLDKYKPMQDQNEINYFGIAHGWAGLLYATLRWCSIANRPLPENFLNRMAQLLGCAVHKENSIYWPLSLTNNAAWHGWCNGSAGHAFLWMLAYNYFKDENFLGVAKKLTNHFNSEVHGNNSNLCCGMAGQAYAMLELFKITGDMQYLNGVERIKKLLLKNLSSPQLRNNSLYKGEVGLGVLFCESEMPAFARMPLFE